MTTEYFINGYEQIMKLLGFLFFGDSIWRVKVTYDTDGVPVVKLDLHQMKYKEAEKTITNVISLLRFSFKLCLIHGYNHGTVLKDMIRNDYSNKRIVGAIYPMNAGETILKIA